MTEMTRVTDVDNGDIQIIEMFTGPPGKTVEFHVGENAPAYSLGVVGDVYIVVGSNADRGNVYRKVNANTWDLVGSLLGPAGGVSTVNGKTGDVVLTIDDIENLRSELSSSRTFTGATAPESGSEGDLWLAGDNVLHRHDGTEWVSVRDAGIAEALALATNAASRVATHIGPTAPTEKNANDLWFDTSVEGKNKVSYWTGSDWEDISDSRIAEALTAANDALATAQAAEVTADQTADSLDAISATLNTRVRTFFQSTVPVAMAAGDLWINSGDNNHLYRAMSAGANEVKAGEWVSARDGSIAAVAALADSANQAALNAMTEAQQAQALADGAIRTHYGASAPWANGTTQPNEHVGDMWFNSTTGRASRWDGTTWVLITDDRITQALSDAADAQAAADGKITAFYQDAAPTGADTGDLWYDTNDGNKPYYWTGSAWTTIQDQAISDAKTAALAAQATAVAADSKAEQAQTAADVALADAADAAAIADGKVSTHFDPDQPTGLTAADVGDLWFDTNDGYKMYRWDGSAWIISADTRISQAMSQANNAQVLANAKTTTFYQSTVPTSISVGDLWVNSDDDNSLYRAESIGANEIQSGEWVSVRDTSIAAAAASAAAAHLAAADALTAAQQAAAVADGNISTHYQASPPWPDGSFQDDDVLGDMWFNADTNQAYRWNGSMWVIIADNAVAQALAAAMSAQTTADGKINAYYASTAPVVNGEGAPLSVDDTGDLWFDLSSQNRPYYWDGAEWLSVRDASIADAANAAATANALASEALSEAERARSVADGSVRTYYSTGKPWSDNLYSGHAMASNAGWVGTTLVEGYVIITAGGVYSPFIPTTAPKTASMRVEFFNPTTEDIFSNWGVWSTGANGLFADGHAGAPSEVFVPAGGSAVWTGEVTLTGEEGGFRLRHVSGDAIGLQIRSVLAFTTDSEEFVDSYPASDASFADMWYDSDDNVPHRWNGMAWVEIQDAGIAAAMALANEAQSTADGKINAYYSATEPTVNDNGDALSVADEGDLWYDTGDQNRPHYWDGSNWQSIQDERVDDLAVKVDQSVKSYSVQYAVNTSETVAPTTGWSTATPTRSPGAFIWTRTLVTYQDNTTNTTNPALLTGNTGATGSQGIPGPAGADGTERYTWLKYADTPTTGMSDSPVGKTYMGIAYNQTSATESSNYSVYQWSLIKGADGTDGKGISTTTVNYAKSTDGVNAPTTGWSPTIPTTVAGEFLWTRTVTNYTDSSNSVAYSVARHGATGGAGRGVSGSTVSYQVHSNGTTAPTGTWLTTIPATSPGQFLWTRTVTTYTDNQNPTTAYAVAAHGVTGQQGIQGPPGANGQPTYTWIKYGTSAAGAGMSDDPTGKAYIGIAYNKTTQTESTVATDYVWSLIQGPTGSQGPAGPTGATGVSITSVTPYYAQVATGATAPAQPTTQATPPAPWQATEPDYVFNTELYRTDRIAYSNSTYAYTSRVKSSAYTAAVTAITAANGKNKIMFSGDNPSGTNYTDGDIWYKKSGSDIIAIWEFISGSWQPRTLRDEVLKSLSVGKLVSGSIDAASVTLTGNGVIQSANYDTSNTGFRLTASGINIKGIPLTISQVSGLGAALDSKATPADIQAAKSTNYGYRYYKMITVGGDHDKYYPVVLSGGDQTVKRDLLVKRSYSELHPPEWNPTLPTHGGGLTLKIKWNFGGWGGAAYSWEIHELEEQYNPTFGGAQVAHISGMGAAVYLRGGGAVYHLYSDHPLEGQNSNIVYTDGSAPVWPLVVTTPTTVGYGPPPQTYTWPLPGPRTAPNTEEIRTRRFIALAQQSDTLLGGWKHPTDQTKIDGGDIYTGSVRAAQIGANSITSTHLMVADVNNYADINEHVAGSVSYGNWASTSVGGWAGRSITTGTGDTYFMFNNPAIGNMPFSENDELLIRFDAVSDSPITTALTMWSYGGPGGSTTVLQPNISIGTSGAVPYEYHVKLDNIALVNRTHFLIGLNSTSLSGRNVRVRNVRIFRKNKGEMIVDGAIKANHVETGSLASRHISVGDFTNYIGDAALKNPDLSQNWEAGLTRVAPTATTPGYIEWQASAPPSNAHRYNKYEFEVKQGDKFYFECEASTPAANTANVTLVPAIEVKNGAGAALAWNNPGATTLPPNTDWTPISGEITIGSLQAATARFGPYSQSPTAGNYIRMRNMVLRKKDAGKLIVDGSIEAKHVVSDVFKGKTFTVATGGVIESLNYDSSASGFRLTSTGINIKGAPLTISNVSGLSGDLASKETPAAAQAKADAALEAARLSANKINNFTSSGNLNGWSIGGSFSTLEMVDFNGTSIRALRTRTSGDVYAGTTAYFNVDPTKAYAVSVWVRRDAVTGPLTGSAYMGITAAGVEGNLITPVNRATGVIGTNSNNFYFRNHVMTSGQWENWIAYIFPSSATETEMSDIGRTVNLNARMLPGTQKILLRFLNYYNAGNTSDMYIANPSVTEVSLETIRAASLTQRWRVSGKTTIDGGTIEADTIRARSIAVADFNNYVADPDFRSLATTDGEWGAAPGVTNPQVTDGPNGHNNITVLRFSGGATRESRQNTNFAVNPGEEYVVKCFVRGNASATAGSAMVRFRFYNSDKTTSSPHYTELTIPATEIPVAPAWREISFNVTIPPNKRYGGIDFVVTSTVPSAATIEFAMPRAFRKASGELIVDGAVTTRHLRVTDPADVFLDPHITDSIESWTVTGGTASVGTSDYTGTANGRALVIPAGQTPTLKSRRFKVDPGAQYRVSSVAKGMGSMVSVTGYATETSTTAVGTTSTVSLGVSASWTTTTEQVFTAAANANWAEVNVLSLSGGVSIDQVHVRRMFGGELVVDGTIKTEHMAAGTIDAKVISAGTLSVQQLSVGNLDNILSDPRFIVESTNPNLGKYWSKHASGTVTATDGRGGTPAYKLNNNATAQSFYHLNGIKPAVGDAPYMEFDVDSGQQYKVSAWIRQTAAIPASGVCIGVRWRSTSGALTYDWVSSKAKTAAEATVWHKVEGILPPAPADVKSMAVYVESTSANSTGVLYIDFISMTRATNSQLVVDGSIQADHLAAGSVNAKSLNVTAGGNNLLDNSDATADAPLFPGIGTTVTRDTAFKMPGKLASFKMTVNTTSTYTGYGMRVLNNVDVANNTVGIRPNTTYTATQWVYMSDTAIVNVSLVASGDGQTRSPGFTSGPTITTKNQWIPVTCTFTTNATGTVTLSNWTTPTSLTVGKHYWVGQVILHEGDVPQAWAPKQQELLPGTITATMLTADAINGKIITGTQLRTAADGSRVEVGSTGSGGQVGDIRIYNANNNFAYIRAMTDHLFIAPPVLGHGAYLRIYNQSSASNKEAQTMRWDGIIASHAVSTNHLMGTGGPASVVVMASGLYVENTGVVTSLNSPVGMNNYVTIGSASLPNSVTSPGINATVYDGPSVNIHPTNNIVGRTGSSARYKTDIRPLTDLGGRSFLDLDPIMYKSKAMIEAYENGEASQKPQDIPGYLAEEVVKEFPELVFFDEEGRPDSLRYERMTAYLALEVRALRDQLEDEKIRNEELETRLERIERALENSADS